MLPTITPVTHFNEISDLKRSFEKNPRAALPRHEQASKGTSLSALSSSSLARIPIASALVQRQLFLHISVPAAVRFRCNVYARARPCNPSARRRSTRQPFLR